MAYMTKNDAYALLKEITNQDFGYDADKWEKWIEENGLPALGMPPRKEVENSIYAGLEFQKQGYTTRKCLRCGGELIITIEAKTYHIECENKDFTFSWTLP